MVKSFGGNPPKLGVLVGDNIHSLEHYGILVTYMRLQSADQRAGIPAAAEKVI